MIDDVQAGGGAIRLVAPVDPETKATLRRKGAGKPKRFKSQLRRLTAVRIIRDPRERKPLRSGFNPEDFKVAREIAERYTPARVPQGLRRFFKGPLDLQEALLIYVLRVEFAWQADDLCVNVGRGEKVQRRFVACIEEARDAFDFIELACERAGEHRNGLL